MKISERANAIAPFFAMEFGKRAAALEAQGHHIIKLSIGEPDFGAPPAVAQAAAEVMDGRSLAYTSALGMPALREAIAGFYRDVHDVDVHPSRIIVTAGASAALLLVTAALVDPGDEVMVGDPSYPCNRQFLASFGAQVKLVPTDATTRFQLDAAAVRANWTEKTRGLMIATPSNPTGTSIPSHELKAICAWAQQHDAWRIVDEIYLNLGDHVDGRAPQTALAFDADAIVINSFSKYFGMTGWRLGWCVVPDALVPAMERLAQNYYICPSTISQHAALACFTQESLAVCEARRREFTERRALVLEGLARIGLPVPVPPDGAFYVYFDVGPTGLTSWEFCERALEEAHVALTPGRDFGACGADTYVRLSYAASTSDLAEAIERLGRLTHRLNA
ncbi:pyridoxal phosphate-dependent aminotransferase [Burkholderia gladioli pv. gladioli]|uniref:pyridoxal phosphate-dependent aminotransferase n=1 Tax=Burkholderia gladioli TaxID=28095 RepID=UPI0024BCABC2|nr:pyridoxal phosphate-dependent aminotransferase [Burkholderia gladioli]MDJ1163938.1 pyridoxal phosphate-dependent aminotransferase [Burkholderia gladioli pv. gladioli]